MQRRVLIAVLFALALLSIALPGVAAQTAGAQPEELWEEFPLDSDKSPPPKPEGQQSPAPEEKKQTAPQTSAPFEGERAADESGRDGPSLWLLPALGLLAFVGGVFAVKAASRLTKRRREAGRGRQAHARVEPTPARASTAQPQSVDRSSGAVAARKRRRQHRRPVQPVPPSRKSERMAQSPTEEQPAREASAAVASKAPAEMPAAKANEPAPAQPPAPAKPEKRERPAAVKAEPAAPAEPVKAKAPAEPVQVERPVPAEPEQQQRPADVKAEPAAPAEPVKAELPAPAKEERPAPVKAEPPAPAAPKRAAPVEAERSDPVEAERPAPPPPVQAKPQLPKLAPPQRIGLPDDVIPFPTRPGRIGKHSAPQLALGYVSASDAESQTADLEAQTVEIRAACERNGFASVEVVRDFESHSGSDLERPGLIYALERLEAGEASALVVASLERLTRSAAHLGTLIDRLGESGIRLVVLDIQLDTGDPDGRLAAEALANVGTLERKSLDIRTRKGLQAARDGRRSSGRPAVADRPVLKDRIADMRARGMTLQAIADTLNLEGVPTLRGGAEWRPSSVQAAVGYKRPKRGARKAGNGSADGGGERNGGSGGSVPSNGH